MKKTKAVVSKEVISYLKSILTSQLLLEANEELTLTNRYKGSLKQQINRVNTMLDIVVKEEFDSVYNSDPEMCTNILNKIDAIINRITKLDIDELVLVDSIIVKYIDNKEWFLKHAEAEFLKLD